MASKPIILIAALLAIASPAVAQWREQVQSERQPFVKSVYGYEYEGRCPTLKVAMEDKHSYDPTCSPKASVSFIEQVPLKGKPKHYDVSACVDFTDPNGVDVRMCFLGETPGDFEAANLGFEVSKVHVHTAKYSTPGEFNVSGLCRLYGSKDARTITCMVNSRDRTAQFAVSWVYEGKLNGTSAKLGTSVRQRLGE